MLKYVIRRRTRVYVDGFAPHFPVSWTRNVGAARRFRTKREALEYLDAADVPRNECEIVRTACVKSDAKLEAISKSADVRDLMIFDPGETSAEPGPTDQGLASVGKMTNLEQLTIYAHAITDAGLVRLSGMAALRKLHIKNTQVTEKGIERLREALVDCKIIWIPAARFMPTSGSSKRKRITRDTNEKVDKARIATQERLAHEREVAAAKKASAANRREARHRRNCGN